MNPMSVIREAIEKREWPPCTLCGQCAKKRKNYSTTIRIRKKEFQDCVRLKCPEGECAFDLSVPFDWTKFKASSAIQDICERVTFGSEEEVRNFVMNLKYTHPGYFISQKRERDMAQPVVAELISALLRESGVEIRKARILVVGANNCYELLSLPYGWKEENIFAVDVSSYALARGKVRFPGISTLSSSIERFSLHVKDLALSNSFDICLILRTLQSSGLHIWSALVNVSQALKRTGSVLISVPKKTVTFSGGVRDGIWNNGRMDIERPITSTEYFAKELSRSDGPRLFTDVTLRYGNVESMEYYVTARYGTY